MIFSKTRVDPQCWLIMAIATLIARFFSNFVAVANNTLSGWICFFSVVVTGIQKCLPIFLGSSIISVKGTLHKSILNFFNVMLLSLWWNRMKELKMASSITTFRPIICYGRFIIKPHKNSKSVEIRYNSCCNKNILH